MYKSDDDSIDEKLFNAKRQTSDEEDENTNSVARAIKKAKKSWKDAEQSSSSGSSDLNFGEINGERATTSSNVNRTSNNGTSPLLRRWQSKQLAQSIVDNAINKVLGDLNNSSPVHANLGCLNPQIIENEGVAIAIRQQGLQRRQYMATLAAAESTWDSNGFVVGGEDHMRTDDNNQIAHDEDDEPLVGAEDLLNQAVSCAISRKGLASVTHD